MILQGDFVVIMEDNAQRDHWPLGRILQTLPGKDGVVRTTQVKSKGTICVRPVVKLILLELTTK